MRTLFPYSKIAALVALLFFIGCKKDDPSVQPVPGLDECDPSVLIENTHTIEGYSDRNSYYPGETMELKIHSLTEFCTIEIIRHGLVDETIDFLEAVPCSRQDFYCRSYSFGCDWETTTEYVLPGSLVSGIYSAKLTNELGESFDICFVVKGNGSADFAVLANTNTWQAYNSWGGQSFYRYELNEKINRSTIISFDRPNTVTHPEGNKGHLVEAELHLYRWMETNAYTYDVFSDRDLHDNLLNLNDYGTLVLNVHPEYWTAAMRSALVEFVDHGGNVINLGANGIYWRTFISGNRIEKKNENVPFYLDQSQTGGKWRTLGKPESGLLGVAYDRRGYNTYHPYAVKNSEHWIFTGTALENNDLFGATCLNGDGASGHETDKMTHDSPSGTVFLAKGTNPDWGGASMTYYLHPSGGQIFSVGSITYTGSLAVDADVHQITKNVFDAFSE